MGTPDIEIILESSVVEIHQYYFVVASFYGHIHRCVVVNSSVYVDLRFYLDPSKERKVCAGGNELGKQTFWYIFE